MSFKLPTLSILASIMVGCATQPPAHKDLGIRHVVVIGVDGLSPDGIRKAATPVLDRLMAEGAYTLQARCVTPSSSSSNWASMIMGADVEQHGVHSNDYERDNFILPPVVKGKEDIFPTIFSEIDGQVTHTTIGAIYHWGGFGRLFEKSAVDYDTAAPDENTAAQLAATFIRQEKPTFCFVHLDHVDHAGHESGHGSPAYYASVSKADSLIGQIIAAIEAAGIADRTLVIVSSDHGGIGLGHGGLTMAEMEIPFLLWGHGIKKGYRIPTPVYQYDNAATVAFALGLERPYAWIGRPVQCAFEGFAEPPLNYPVPTFLEKPILHPKAIHNQRAGGLFFSDTTIHMENPNTTNDTELRYTLDGSLPTASSPRYNAPIPIKQNTVVRSGVFRQGKLESEVVEAHYRFVPAGKKPPVRYTCYLVDGIKQLPDFRNLRPVASGRIYEITSDEVPLPRPQQIAVAYECKIRIKESGRYTFFTRSDDGSKLYLDGKLVVDNDGDHGVQEKSGKIELVPGDHSIRVEWFNGGGGGWLDVCYQGPGISKQVVPVGLLF
ncbi:MAG: alkaline phosphatase family protein [Saprospiraceae bacterium]|nr:alkaline phosphatase family protein [Saprospiraceae bacterium]